MTRSIAVVIALVASAYFGTAVAHAATVTMAATVNGQNVAAGSVSEPLRLEPGRSIDVVIELTNRGAESVYVRRVDLAGRVLGLNFFTYTTIVDVIVEPATSDTLRYRLDLTGLEGQATGLIAGALTVTDATGAVIATIPTVTDVRGSVLSVYGLFGIALIVLTTLALLDAAVAIARHRLSVNRWRRGLRLITPGIGIGLVLAFSASVLRLWVPDTGLWLVVASSTAAAFFALGYFSPTPDDDDDEDLDEEDDLDELDSDTEQLSADGLAR